MVLADFFADWCEPCKMLDKILEDLEDRLNGKAHIIKVDADQSDELKTRYNMRSVPVLLLFKDGMLVWRMNGFMMTNEMEKKVLEFV